MQHIIHIVDFTDSVGLKLRTYSPDYLRSKGKDAAVL